MIKSSTTTALRRALPRWLELWILKRRANTEVTNILLAADRRENYLVAAGQLNTWITAAQKRLAILNAKVAALENPQKLIAEATRPDHQQGEPA